MSVIIPFDMIPKQVQTIVGNDEKQGPENFSFTMPKPYAPWQAELMTSKCNQIITLNGTKTGKTLGGSGRIGISSFLAPKEQDAIYRIVAPTYKITGITYKYLCRLFPAQMAYQKSLSPKQNEIARNMYERWRPKRTPSRHLMEWPHNNCTIQCMHGTDPESSIEGERTHGNLLDEASKMSEQVYASVLTTTSQTGGWIAMTTTPRGSKHWTAKLFKEFQAHMKWCEQKGKPYEKLAYQVPTWTSPYVKKSVIEHARKTLPDWIFRQVYGAEILDEGSVFMGMASMVYGPEIRFRDDDPEQQWVHADSKEMEVVLGCDWAKKSDWTVVTAWTYNERFPRMVGFYRLQGKKYKSIIAKINAWKEAFKHIYTFRHDKTGIGDVIDEMLYPLNVPIDGVAFTSVTKPLMVTELVIGVQNKEFSIPNWDLALEEMGNFEATTNALGMPKYEAADGHDDIVCSMMLGWTVVSELREGISEVMTLDDLLTDELVSDIDDTDEIAQDDVDWNW